MDLSGHQLAERLGDIAPVTPRDFGRLDEPDPKTDRESTADSRSNTDSLSTRDSRPASDSKSKPATGSMSGSRPESGSKSTSKRLGSKGSGGGDNTCDSCDDASGGEDGAGDPAMGAAGGAVSVTGSGTADAERPCVSDIASPFQAAADEHRDTSIPDSPHPMLSNEQWADLSATVPEVTESLGSLTELAAQLQDFRRPMGPDEAVTVMQGLEALSRIVDLLSAVTLSVFERTGTPKDYGAKSTKALVQDKLKLSGSEAHRRTELAKNLGNRVDITGQSRPPKYPLVAEGLQSGRLSSSQATTITECLKDLPFWLGSDMRTKVEQKLVARAPTVRVSDIRRIFADMLDRLDPDGEEPKDSHDRSHYRVNVRQRRDGDWDLSGLLDPISGGILQGWLTSRIKADDPASGDRESTAGDHAASPDGSSATGSLDSAADDSSGAVQGAGQGEVPPDEQDAPPDTCPATVPTDGRAADEQEIIDLFGSVLSGDISDARIPADAFPTDPSQTDAAPNAEGSADVSVPQNRGWGVREDGSFVDTADAQGSVKNLMYERFATLLSRIEMGRVGRGAPFALVVTATAENLAEKKGRAETGDEAEFPVDLAVDEGLNGSVFFHLMSDKAKSLSLATEQRYATPKQLAVLAARDQGCTFPGCETPPGWCDAHHIVPWSNGGKTDINNLTLACGLHHHLIDKSDWYAYMLFDGRPAWIPPASIDVERRPILHARFIAREAAESLFDEVAGTSAAGVSQRGTSAAGVSQRGTSAAQDGPKGTNAPTVGPDEASGPGIDRQGTSAMIDGRLDTGGPARDPDPPWTDAEWGDHEGSPGDCGPGEVSDPPGYSDCRGDDDSGDRT
ncbi:DUF222 domain-containing protein [Brevibacterium ammoniilyticum]|uniref:DUF222 domain-containing protein n=1 Tax=Brevibacterium ammoniilyticum TaxID=1046555 RepID=UPI0031CDCF5A